MKLDESVVEQRFLGVVDDTGESVFEPGVAVHNAFEVLFVVEVPTHVYDTSGHAPSLLPFELHL